MAANDSYRYDTTDSHQLAVVIANLTGPRGGWVVVSLVIVNPWWWRPWKYRYEVTFARRQVSVPDSLKFNFGPVTERVIPRKSGPR